MTEITKKELEQDLLRVKDIINHIPTINDYKRHGKYPLFSYTKQMRWTEWQYKLFGTTAIYQNYHKKKIVIDEDEIVEEIRQLKNKIGRIPRIKDYKKHGNYPFTRIERTMGWNKWLMKALGEVNNPVFSNNRKIPKEKIIEDIIKVKEKVDRIPTIIDYKKYGMYSGSTYRWGDLIKEAFGDINHHYYKKHKKEDLIAYLHELNNKFGRPPEKKELTNYHYDDYCFAFGSYSNALIEAKLLHPLARKGVTKQEVIDEINRVYLVLGHYPSMREFREISNLNGFFLIHKYLSYSWEEAMKMVGIEKPVITQEDVKRELWNRYNKFQDISCLEYWKIRKDPSFIYSPHIIKSRFPGLMWDEIMVECGFDYVSFNHFYGGGRRRGQYIGNDGIYYLSTLERDIGNVLFNMKNDGLIDDYEYEVPVCEERNWTCDFLIYGEKEIYLEADGMKRSRNDPYWQGNEKIEYYKKNGINFKIISYDCRNIEKKVRSLSI